MAEQQSERKKGAPTEKMVDSAKRAADRHGVKLPTGVDKDFDVCKAFLDKYLNLPTAKALSYAEKIAKDKGVALTDEARANSKALSEWIDANK